jgi:hypothetical protein
MRSPRWPLAAALALGWAPAAWAADPIAYTAPDGTNAVAVTAAHPLPVAQSGAVSVTATTPLPVAPAYGASGVSPVSASITAAGASGAFTPIAGRAFHVQLSGTASATCTLERQLDGATWVPITATAAGATTLLYNWTYTGSALSEDVTESQYGVPYRVDCGAQLGSFTSGTLGVRVSQ